MRLFYTLLLAYLFIHAASGQPWLKNLPQDKSRSEYTFYDYQRAFESYWAPFNVDYGFYEVNGHKVKAPGWKQFKRWEYEMESKIDKETGAFPEISAHKIVEKYFHSRPQPRTTNANWSPLGPDYSIGGYHGVGRINCVAFHPTDINTYWVGAAAGGLWETRNNGSSWTCLTDQNGVLAVSDIIIPSDYDVSRTIYISTGDRDGFDNRSIGVLKSTDGGQTWNETDIKYRLADNAMVNRLLIDPNNSNTLLAATTYGVYRTTDGGQSWKFRLTEEEFIDMEAHPANFNIIYGSTKDGYIFYSPNGGANWNIGFFDDKAFRIEIAVTPGDPTLVYAIAAATDNGLYGIFKSTNSGQTFEEVFSGNDVNLLTWAADGSEPGGQGYYDLCIAASPHDPNTLLVGGVNTWRSKDGGQSWHIVNHWVGDAGQEVHADKHNLRYRSNGDLFECNDGGIYLSYDNGYSWMDKTNGIAISQMYKLSVAQTAPNEVLTGLQDNGTKLLSEGNWLDVKGADGMDCLIDYTDHYIQYGTVYYGRIERTLDHWENKEDIEPEAAGSGAWVTPFALDPVNPKILYGGYRELWKTFDRGDNWIPISTMSSGSRLRSLSIAPSNNEVVYTADPSSIWKTTNGGDPGVNITYDLPVSEASIQTIAVKYDDPTTLWVAMSGYDRPGVYQLRGGETNWENISAGLPLIPAYSIVQDNRITDKVVLYVGTEVGVYMKEGDANWVPFNQGLPNVKIGEIEIYYGSDPEDAKLLAATYGRGMWETPLPYSTKPMELVSASTYQATLQSVASGQANTEILRVEVLVNGSEDPLKASSLTFTTEGSTDPLTDIESAKVYYTGNSFSFSTDNQFGLTKISPNGTFKIEGLQTLVDGVNNFWLAYDVSAGAVAENLLDAQCTFVKVNIPRTPKTVDPEGARKIGTEYCPAGVTESANQYISSVSAGSVLQESLRGDGGYEDHTANVIEMEKQVGEFVTVLVANSTTRDRLLMWVDWNFDRDFNDQYEQVYTSFEGESGFYQVYVSPPPTARNGLTRMRVRVVHTTDGPNNSPCGSSTWGEVEDYSIRIKSPEPCTYLNYPASNVENIMGGYVGLDDEGTLITTDNTDNANSEPQDIGFTFEFNCAQFDQFILNTNGFIKLGDTPPSAPDLFFDAPQAPWGGVFNSSDDRDRNLLVPFNHDLISGDDGAEFRVHTSGVAPDRVCTIQFKGMVENDFWLPNYYDHIEYQIKLYETSNVIEFVYGDWDAIFTPGDARAAAIGLKGSTPLDNQLLVVSKSVEQGWDEVTFANRNYGFFEAFFFSNSLDSPKPANGRTFRFVPVKQHDLEIREVYTLADASFLFSNPQVVSVHLRNAGLTDLADVPVTLTISGANTHQETKILHELNAGESTTLAFSEVMMDMNGNTHIEASLANDENLANNVMSRDQNNTQASVNYATDTGADGSWQEILGGHAFYNKYLVHGSASIDALDVFIANADENVGHHIVAQILYADGTLAGRSLPYTIEALDLGTWKKLDIMTPPVITNNHFYAGARLPAIGIQVEDPIRPHTYYTSLIDGSKLKEMEGDFGYRFMIGARLSYANPAPGVALLDSPVCLDGTAIITLNESVGNIQWQQSPDGVADWQNVTDGNGANDEDYFTPPLAANAFYRAEITQPGFPAVYSNVVEVPVLPSPGLPGAINGDTLVCQGARKILYTIDPVENATSYVWTLPSEVEGTSSSTELLVSFDLADTLSIIEVRGQNEGCAGEPAFIAVKVNPRPGTPYVGNLGQPTCTNPSGFIKLANLPQGGPWVLWDLVNSTEITGTGSSKTITGLPAGTYNYIVTNSLGCVSQETGEIVLNPQPIPPTPTITANSNILHSDAPVGNQWYNQNGILDGATQQDYFVTLDGDYYTIVTINNCPSDTSNILNITGVGDEVLVHNSRLNTYPNPVRDQLIIEMDNNTLEMEFEIVNFIGQVIHRGHVTERAIINTSSLAPGVYTVKVMSGDEFDFRKVIKE
jgi:photosystem II stability/assembly factor-like uncharacterized protein